MSDLELPEHAGRAAFAELAELVRHVSEQLAGYRRRALSAEAQVRELERSAERASDAARSLQEVTAQSAVLEQSLREARAEVLQRTRALEAAERRLASEAAERQLPQRAERSHPDQQLAILSGQEDAALERAELQASNTALRDRLDEANVRTGQIVERVRFLRQQLSAGSRS